MKTALYLLLLIAFLPGHAVFGDELKLVPSATVREEFNDNIFFSVNDRKSDFITTLSPGIDFSRRSERLEVGLNLRLDGIVYAGNDNLNSLDQNYKGRLRYQLTPQAGLSAEAGYGRDSRPDRDLETTGLVIGAVRRDRQNYSLSGNYVLSERTSASLSYVYQQDVFDNARFTNMTWHDVSLDFTHDLSRWMPATKGLASFGYAHYTFAGSTVDNYSATIGASRAFNEKWSLLAYAGGRYTRSVFETVQPQFLNPFIFILVPVTSSSNVWGWVGQLALSCKGEKTDGSLTFNSDIQPASGQTSGTTVRTSVVANIGRRFSYELYGGMSLGYYRNKSNPGEFSGQAINEETLSVAPRVRYEFTRDMSIETSYQFTRVLYKINDTEANRNLFFVRFYIQNPFFL